MSLYFKHKHIKINLFILIEVNDCYICSVCLYALHDVKTVCLQADREAEKDKVINYNFILSICFFSLLLF